MDSRYKKYEKSYKDYKVRNKDKIKQLQKAWYLKNRKKSMERTLKRKDLIRFGGKRRAVLERDNWTCQNCGMTQEEHVYAFGRSITIDHIDGSGRYAENPNNSLSNLQTLCLRCHGRKDGERGNIKRRGQKE